MLAWRAMGPRLLALGIMSFLAATILWPVGSANGQPLFQGSLACPAGLPTGEQVGHGLLGALTAPLPAPQTGDPLNNAWLQAAPAIPNQTIVLDRVHVPDGCALGGATFALS